SRNRPRSGNTSKRSAAEWLVSINVNQPYWILQSNHLNRGAAFSGFPAKKRNLTVALILLRKRQPRELATVYSGGEKGSGPQGSGLFYCWTIPLLLNNYTLHVAARSVGLGFDERQLTVVVGEPPVGPAVSVLIVGRRLEGAR